MKSWEKKMILILIGITIIISIIYLTVRNNNKEENIENKPEYIEEWQDGTKQNTSAKLQETKKLEDLEITDIQITELNGEASISANITNNTANKKQEFPITIHVFNKENQLIQDVGAYVGAMQPGETRGIYASIQMEILDIYDITFERAK